MSNAPYYEPGAYVGEVVEQGIAKAKSTGTPQFVLRVRVIGKVDPKDASGYQPVTENERSIYRAITDKTVEYLMEDLKALGFTGASFAELQPGHLHHQSFVGNQIDLYCKHEPDLNGQMRERWNIDRGAPKIESLDAKGMRELDSMFGKHLRAANPTPAKPKPVAKPQQQDDGPAPFGDITDDDIPF